MDLSIKSNYNEYYRQKLYCCFCDTYINRSGFPNHKKSKKHIKCVKKFIEYRDSLKTDSESEEVKTDSENKETILD